ncbi:Inm1p [Saccharomyces cerevisiae Vin13]|nr:Inm1p [Saccharomyces cerevisiae Vin13]
MRVNNKDYDYKSKLESMGSLILNKSVVALQPGSAREGKNFQTKMATYEKLLSCDYGFVHGFRNLGSSAMTMAYIAMGYLDSYWGWWLLFVGRVCWMVYFERSGRSCSRCQSR